MSTNRARHMILPVVMTAALIAGCRSKEDDAADVRLLCEPPKGEDTPTLLLQRFPAAAGYAELEDRLKTSRWKKWLVDVDRSLSTKTSDPAEARRKSDELDAAGRSAGFPSCWAATAVRRWMDGKK